MAKKYTPKENELVLFLNEQNLNKDVQKLFIESFGEYFTNAKQWQEKAKDLVIRSADQIEEMKEARVARLAISKIRIAIEHKRKELKEDSLRTGKVIDTVAKFLTSLITPTELHLEEQEKFVQRLEEAAKEELKQKRLALLQPYEVETQFYDLENMPEELFEKLYSDSKLLFEAKTEKAAKEEENRLKSERYQYRVTRLASMNFVKEGNRFIHENVGIYTYNEQHLMDDPEEDFNSIMAGFEKGLAQIKKEKEEAAQLELERIKNEREERERRLQKLFSMGLRFNDKDKTFSYGEIINLTAIHESDGISLEEFEEIIHHSQEAINAALEEERKLKEAITELITERKKPLFNLGFSANGENMVFQGLVIEKKTLINMESQDWETYIKNIIRAVEQIKKEAEDKRLEDERKAEEDRIKKQEDEKRKNEIKTDKFVELLFADGYKNLGPALFGKSNEGGIPFTVSYEQLLLLNENEFFKRLDEVNEKLNEQLEAELAKGDKEKFDELCKYLAMIAIKNTFKSKKSKKLHEEVQVLLQKVINHIKQKS